MKTSLFVTFWTVVSFCGYAQEQSNVALHGHWMLDLQETMLSFENSEMTAAEVKRFSSILKPAEIVITENLYSGMIAGRKPTNTPYSLVAISDNGECFTLQLPDSSIPLDIQKTELCVTNNKLYLPSVKGAKEVFIRK